MFRKLIPILTPVLFVVALWVLYRELEHFHYHDIVAYLHQIPFRYILLAVLLTAVDYGVLTLYDMLALRYSNKTLPYKTVAPISFISYALGHNLGNTLITGGSVRFRMYANNGLNTLDITKVVLFCELTFFAGYFGLAGFVFSLFPPQILSSLHLPFSSLHPVGYIFVTILFFYFFMTIFKRSSWVLRGIEFFMPSWKICLAQIGIASLDLTLAAGVLYVLLPNTVAISFLSFIGIYLLAIMGGLLSQVPGGLGVFETIIVVLLGEQVADPHIVGSLLIFRGIYYLLPLGFGALLLGLMEFKDRRHELREMARSVSLWIPFIAPLVLSITTFLAGSILLFSGATPAVHGRLGWLNTILPLPILEISHFLGSMAGIGLVLLARSIQRRVDAAYFLTILLLIAGIIFSLLKGFDYEEAILLSIMLAALLPCRRQFRRKSSLLAESFTPGWIAVILLVLIASTWTGIFAYKHVAFSNDLWWHFSLRGDAPRFLRATAGVVGLLFIFSITKLLRPVRHLHGRPDSDDFEQVSSIIAGSSRTSANLVYLGDKSLLFSDSGEAFLMYGVANRSWIALENPVGPEEEWTELLWKFREIVDRQNGWPVFYQVDHENLHRYLDLGLTLLKIGEQARIPLDTFSLEGRNRKGLRHTSRKLEKEGCSFEMVPPDRVESILPSLKSISDAWLSDKHSREKSFSLGFFHEDYLKRFPCAVALYEGTIVAFANILPTVNRDELSLDLMRFTSQAPRDVMEYLFIQIMLWGKQEGYHDFNMGMAPLAGLENRPLAPLWNRVGGMIFRHGEHFYNFEGLREYKNKFDPIWKPKYLASPGGLALPRIFMDLTSLIGGGLKGVLMK